MTLFRELKDEIGEEKARYAIDRIEKHRREQEEVKKAVLNEVPMVPDYTGLAKRESAYSTRTMRQFDTGATRDSAQDKPDYEGFISPLVEKRFGQYMHTHRKQADGNLRASDNWQKGIPKEAYIASLMRHIMDLRLHHDGFNTEAVDKDLESVLCAIRFNVDGYLFEVLKGHLGYPTRG